MNIKETHTPKISMQEADKLQAMSETVRDGKIESTTAAADEKLLQRLDKRPDMETTTLTADSEVNSGKSIDYGMMFCSDRCIKSRVSSGRCFHA